MLKLCARHKRLLKECKDSLEPNNVQDFLPAMESAFRAHYAVHCIKCKDLSFGGKDAI